MVFNSSASPGDQSGSVCITFAGPVLVDGKSVYPLQAGTVGASQESTDVLISMKSLVYGVLNTTTYELWGPSVVVIRVWHE